jgi:cobalt-precorrin-5B (C1)-methyltransferase
VPLKEIRREASRLLPGGASITVSIPGGEELAARTFNPRLGIVGGLSILGTTGRVEPWSTRAYQESLLPQLDVALAAGVKRPALVPGAKGERAALRIGFDAAEIVQAGNFFGMMLTAAAARGYRRVALAGHASKIAKIARGDFDTHSRRSGAPLDVLADCARAAGLSKARVQELGLMPTTEQAVRSLRAAGQAMVLDEAARRAADMVKKNYGLSAEIYLTDAAGEVVGHA